MRYVSPYSGHAFDVPVFSRPLDVNGTKYPRVLVQEHNWSVLRTGVPCLCCLDYITHPDGWKTLRHVPN